ncbi:hypothetical protein ABTF15_16775 [Acinetobacter baumannii]
MVEIPNVSNFTDALNAQLTETNKQKVKNSEIQRVLSKKIDDAIIYFADLKKGKHISEEMLEEQPGMALLHKDLKDNTLLI